MISLKEMDIWIRCDDKIVDFIAVFFKSLHEYAIIQDWQFDVYIRKEEKDE